MQSSKASNQIQEEEEKIKVLSVDKLQEQFSNLQQDWDIIKKSNPSIKKLARSHFYSSSTSTITSTNSYSSSFPSSNLIVKTLDLLHQSSPRNLMLSLQSTNDLHHHRHRSIMITRPTDSEVREIVRDRKEAIGSGSLKGRRRLFDQSYDVLDEVRSVLSFDESSGENESFCGTGDIKFLRRYSCSLSGQRSQVLNKEKMSPCKNRVLNIHSLLLFVVAFVIYVIIRNFSEFDFGERDVILVPT